MDDARVAAFVRAACVPLEGGHGAGTLAEAEAIVLPAGSPEQAAQGCFSA